jgi:hypothetical protein
MGHKVITWVDLEGRVRTTLPAYEALAAELGLDEQGAVDFAWSKLVSAHGLTEDHPHFQVDSDMLIARRVELSANDFRYVAIPDSNGRRSGVGGAWEMGDDGLPIVNMTKARAIHMDTIRISRNAELVKKDVPFMQAVETGDTDAQATIGTEKQTLRDIPQTFDITTDVDTPEKLKAKWPTELPDRE